MFCSAEVFLEHERVACHIARFMTGSASNRRTQYWRIPTWLWAGTATIKFPACKNA
jgi:hypothetical protein